MSYVRAAARTMVGVVGAQGVGSTCAVDTLYGWCSADSGGLAQLHRGARERSGARVGNACNCGERVWVQVLMGVQYFFSVVCLTWW